MSELASHERRQATMMEAAMGEWSDIQLPADQYVKVGQVSTRFWQVGAEGSTVVLVHGLAGSMEVWALNIEDLSKHHRVFALDLVGFGRTDKPSVSYSGANLARFLNDFMATQGIESASVIGHSLGGGVGLEFALQYPEKLEKLVLVASSGLGRECAVSLRLCTLPLAGEILSRPSRKGTARFIRRCVRDPSLVTDEIVDEAWKLSALPGAQKTFLATLRDNANLRGVKAETVRTIVEGLDTITAPTLIVWGRDDRLLPVAHAFVAERGIPNSRLTVIQACGHSPQLERPSEFNALVTEFLAH
jgi:4,5:9,10-diseco-3-hydroxy-5,9,17-trioxoandrosta-1(10),2-diene-4-oate hydrolase